MSNFQCPECGAYIIEGKTGEYITGCEHYPMRRKKNNMRNIRKARKKPVIVEFIEWTGDNLEEVVAFTGRHESTKDWSWEFFNKVVRERGLKIFTAEGPIKASIGDIIIKGVNGEFYPCKPDIFKKTYEEI